MFDLPQDINEAAKGSLSGTNTKVPLPFPAPELWWKNGEPAIAGMKEIVDARRFGGWGISKEEIDNMSMLPPLGVYLIALLRRLSIITPISLGSPMISGILSLPNCIFTPWRAIASLFRPITSSTIL